MQKLKKKRKKMGFTLTELAIVIAVIAILIAVLVPTFIALIDKANKSADQQTAKNLNTALSVYEAEKGKKPSDLDEAREALVAAGYSSELEPATKGYYYYWNSEYNIVMLVDISDNTWDLVYSPSADAENALAYSKAYCYNLNSYGTSLYQDAIVTVANSNGAITLGSATVSNTSSINEKNTAKTAIAAEEVKASSNSMADYTYSYSDFVAAANKTKESFKDVVVTLSTDINLDEVDPIYNFQGTFNGNNKTITIAAGGIKTKCGTTNNGYCYDGNSKYGYGIFASVTDGGEVKNLTVVYNDTVENEQKNTSLSANNPDYKKTYFGGITGFLSDATISGCTVKGSIVQYNRIGGIVGTSYSGNITNCTVEASITSIQYSEESGYSAAGGIVAYVGEDVSYDFTLNISGCTVGSATNSTDDMQTFTAVVYAGGIAATITSGTTKVNISNSTVQNIVVKITKSGNSVGAVCGNLAVAGALSGNVTIKNVSVNGHAESNSILYYDTNGTDSYLKQQQYAKAVYTDGRYNSNILIVVGTYSNNVVYDNVSNDSTDSYGTFASNDYKNDKDQTVTNYQYTYSLFTVTYETSE